MKIDTPYNNNVFGRILKSQRYKNHWSQSEFAQRLNISIPAYSKLETGITDPNLSRVGQIAGVLGLTVVDLVSENNNVDILTELRLAKASLDEKNREIARLQGKLISLYDEMAIRSVF